MGHEGTRVPTLGEDVFLDGTVTRAADDVRLVFTLSGMEVARRVRYPTKEASS